MGVLSRLTRARSDSYLVVAAVDTLVWKLMPQFRLAEYAELVMAGEEIDREALILKLEHGGYHRVSLVEDPGEYAVRGDILDLFVPGRARPVRMDFSGIWWNRSAVFRPIPSGGCGNCLNWW